MSDVDVGVLSQSFPSVHWVFSDGNYLSAQKHGKTAFELFPGLEEIFVSGQPSLHGNDPTLAWRPLYQSGISDLVLWAGQEVRQDVVNIAKKQIYLGIYITSAVLGLVVLLVAFLISFRTQYFFTVLLDSLEGVILHKSHSVKTKYVIFSEVGKFTSELERLTETYKKMEFEREEALESLHQNKQLLLSVTNAVQSAVMLIDETGCVQFFNPAAEQMFGYSQEEMLGRKLHEVITPERFRKSAQAGLAHFFATSERSVLKNPMELIALCKEGTELPIELYVGKVRKNGQSWAVGAAIDISERKIKEQALTRLAATDQLTGVSNRRNFVMLAEQELKRCRRYQIPVFFLMFDLDYLRGSTTLLVTRQVMRFYAILPIFAPLFYAILMCSDV